MWIAASVKYAVKNLFLRKTRFQEQNKVILDPIIA